MDTETAPGGSPKGWRLLDSEPDDPYRNMSIDEAIAQTVRSGELAPTLRFYAWRRPAVSIGYFQRLHEAVDLPRCLKDNISVVRRLTGGKAVFHNREITYSVAAPTLRGLRNIQETYLTLSKGILQGLQRLGIAAELSHSRGQAAGTSFDCFAHAARNEIVVFDRKLVGSAQRRWRDGFLQHGSILLSLDRPPQGYILGADQSGAAISLSELLPRPIDVKAVTEAIVSGLQEVLALPIAPGVLSAQEIALAERLEEKYRGWTARI